MHVRPDGQVVGLVGDRVDGQTLASRRRHDHQFGAADDAGEKFVKDFVAAWDKARRLEDGLAGRGGVAAVPLVPARAVSTPFVLAAGALVVGLAGLSLRAGLP